MAIIIIINGINDLLNRCPCEKISSIKFKTKNFFNTVLSIKTINDHQNLIFLIVSVFNLKKNSRFIRYFSKPIRKNTHVIKFD